MSDRPTTEPRTNHSQTGTVQEIMDEHRECGPRFDGCYSHWPTPHCRADGMAWPCDVDAIRAAIGPHIHAPGQTDKRCRACAEAAQGAAPPAALDVPPEAIEWARELVRQGYRDEHVVTFTEDGYGLEHPIRCRPNLTGCVLNEWLRTQMAPDREPGRYVMEWAEDGPKYTEAER